MLLKLSLLLLLLFLLHVLLFFDTVSVAVLSKSNYKHVKLFLMYRQDLRYPKLQQDLCPDRLGTNDYL